jgi:hypothetical protein
MQLGSSQLQIAEVIISIVERFETRWLLGMVVDKCAWLREIFMVATNDGANW